MNPTLKIALAAGVMALATMGIYQYTQAQKYRDALALAQQQLDASRNNNNSSGNTDLVLPTSTPVFTSTPVPTFTPTVGTATPSVTAIPTATPIPTETKQVTLKVKLYYKDTKKDPNVLDCNADTYVYREIPLTQTPLRDTINLLLVNQLTPAERAAGLSGQFADPQGVNFKLTMASITNGVATLTFVDPDHFSIGGSCRVGIMSEQIIQTAKQFPSVKEVKFKSDVMLFQP